MSCRHEGFNGPQFFGLVVGQSIHSLKRKNESVSGSVNHDSDSRVRFLLVEDEVAVSAISCACTVDGGRAPNTGILGSLAYATVALILNLPAVVITYR